MGTFSELKRRNVFRMAVLYVLVAWLVMQVAGVLMDLGALSSLLGPWLLVALAIGFPIALVFSWFYELTPEGLALEKDVPEAESITHLTGRRMDFVVIAVLSAGLILFAFDKWWPREPPELSIAVLPFENMSGDPGQEYFSDGVSDEILNLLAYVEPLKVIARTSSFSFKGKELDIATIAQQLDVRHILEGSWRRSGNRVRVTAKLIDAKDSSQLWSQTFDRAFADVFAVQDEIAAAVVDALRIRLVRQIPDTINTEPEVYELYLQAKYLNTRNIRRTAHDCEQAGVLLTRALELDPLFVPAWTELAYFHLNACRPISDFQERAENARYAAQQALSIDPDSAHAHLSIASVAMGYDWDFQSAAEHIDRALAINSGDPQILDAAAGLERTYGNLREALRLAQRAASIDPINLTVGLGYYQYLSGEAEKATESFRKVLRIKPNSWAVPYRLGMAYLALGDPNAALAALRVEPVEGWRLTGEAIVHFELGAIDESDAALQQLVEKYKHNYPYQIAWVHSYRGEIDQAFHWLDESYRIRDGGLPQLLVEPMLANLREDPRWEQLVTKLGLVN